MIDVYGLDCPNCEKYTILDDGYAQDVISKRLKLRKRIWKKEMAGMEKMEMLKFVFREREHKFEEFANSSHVLDTVDIITETRLLQEIMRMKNTGKTGSKHKKFEILSMYKEIITEKRYQRHIKSGLVKVFCYTKYRRCCMTENELLHGFEPFYTEEYTRLKNDYKKNNLMTKEEARNLVEKDRDEIEKIKKYNKPMVQTPEERVKNGYDIIRILHTNLLQDDVFRNIFNLKPHKEIIANPDQLERFVSDAFGDKRECEETEFLNIAHTVFKKDIKTIKKILVFEESNPDIFPWFLKIADNSKNTILIDYSMTKCIHLILHAIILEKEFGIVTTNRGKEFEAIPDRIFRKYGFKYFKNKGIKNKIEVDGIAIKDNYCFIVEVKGKMIPVLAMEETKRKTLTRDLKGIVDGYEYTENRKKKKPSMAEKIEFVKQNRKKFGIAGREMMGFYGIVVSRFYQGLSEYNGVKFITDDELEEYLSENNLSGMVCDS